MARGKSAARMVPAAATATEPDDPTAATPVNPPDAKAVRDVFRILGKLYKTHPLHVDPRDHFQVLVAAMLSARTRDPTTNAAMTRLWPLASTPEQMLAIPEADLAVLLKPVGFWNAKAKYLHELSAMLLARWHGKVPHTREELMELPGVGRKVANLVLNICFNTAAICVDVHVHRIVNRLGWIVTTSPEQTELALMDLLPEKYWSPTNLVFVNHGQQICLPVSPLCSKCPIYDYCARVGVTKSR
jgi:endonuclease III